MLPSPPPHLRASVIIPAKDAATVLPGCLAALEQQTLRRDEYEIIVVDDGSSDATATVAADGGARVLRIAHQGAAAARNAGATLARAPVLVFTDADCEPAVDFLEQILEPFATPVVSGARGVYRTQQRQLIPRFVQVEYEERYRRIARYAEKHGTVNALDTSYAAYRKDVFQQAGGFDVRFGSAAGEDHELSFRLAEAGHVFRFNANAVVYHRHVVAAASYARRKFRIGYWKAFLTRQHPSYAVADAHTTQSLKIQIVLSWLMVLCLPVWLFAPAGGWVLLALALCFLASTTPFLALAAERDFAVLWVAMPLLGLRALASGAGFIWGMFRPHRSQNAALRPETTRDLDSDASIRA